MNERYDVIIAVARGVGFEPSRFYAAYSVDERVTIEPRCTLRKGA